MVRHDHVAQQEKIKFRPNFREHLYKKIPGAYRFQITMPVVTAEGDKVKMFLAVVPFQTLRHRRTRTHPCKNHKGRPPSYLYSAMNSNNGILSSHHAVKKSTKEKGCATRQLRLRLGA